MQIASQKSMRIASRDALRAVAMPKRQPDTRVYEPNERLIAARALKYDSPKEAAEAMGVPEPTYRGHENGSRGLGRSAERYARFFGVPLEWLLTGRGAMSGAQTVEIGGYVSAGESVEEAAPEIAPLETVEMPRPSESDAYIVRGDSMAPRFFRGETLIFAKHPTTIERLVGQICRIETWEGTSYVKILRQGREPRRWNLESMRLYEPTIENVEVKNAYRWLALLPPRHVDAFLIANTAGAEKAIGARRLRK